MLVIKRIVVPPVKPDDGLKLAETVGRGVVTVGVALNETCCVVVPAALVAVMSQTVLPEELATAAEKVWSWPA